MSKHLKKLDDLVYRTERFIVVAALILMAVVVFLDVVHRGFAGDTPETSKFAAVGLKVAGLFGVLPDKTDASYAEAVIKLRNSLAAASPYVLSIVFTTLTYFGIRSAKRTTPVAPAIAAGAAVAGVALAYGCVKLLLWTMPNGLIWSQPMALVLTLWVGFVGASMCTYERKHLKVEAVQRFLPEKYKPGIGFVSGIMTTLATLFLFWVSLRYVMFNLEEFQETGGRGGLFQGWAVAKYKGFAVLPVSFAIMSVRFFARSVLALQGKLPDLEEFAPPDDDDVPPSDIATEAVPASDYDDDAKEGSR